MKKQMDNTKLLPVLISLSILLIFLLLSTTDLYKGVKYASEDIKWKQYYHAEKADSNIVIVAIDNKSLEFISEKLKVNWPWPREFYALLVDYFTQAGAASVIFDVLYSESEIGRMEYAGGTSDHIFAKAIENNQAVILASMIADSERLFQEKSPQLKYLEFENSEKFPAKTFKRISPPIDELKKGAADIGIANFHMDEDGICRRLPLIFNINDKYIPQLAFSAYLFSTGDSLISYDEKSLTLITQQKEFHLEKDGYFPIYWYGPGDRDGVFRYDSFHAVMMSAIKNMNHQKPDIPLEEYRNKHIIICASASGLVDLKPTPFTSISAYPGGEIHATLLSNLLNSHTVRNIHITWIFIIYFILLSLIAYSFLTRTLKVSLFLAFGILFVTVLFNLILFNKLSVNFDLIFPASAIIFVSTAASMYRIISEGQAKRQIKSMFSRYLSTEVIDLLMKNPDKVDLRGSEVTGTVLFTDLQNFTTFSEKKSPRDVIEVLNNYFGIITGIVLKHRGLLDKYTGDGIMAIFGAPITRKDHAHSACEVILEFGNHNVNELIPTEEGEIATRIGISSGSIVVGNLGSTQRMDYTAIGDTVNLSARLEGVCKNYGITNMVSEFTWEYVKNDYFFREIDFIRVKGKNLPIRVFTLVDRLENMTGLRENVENLFIEAMAIYRKRDWKKAIKAFEKVLEAEPNDNPSKAFIDRCNLLKKHPNLVDSDGVFTFKTK